MQVIVWQAGGGSAGSGGEQHPRQGLQPRPGGDFCGQVLRSGPSIRLLRVGLPGQQRPGDGPCGLP